MARALVVYDLQKGKIIAPRIAVGRAEPHPHCMSEAEVLLSGDEPGAGSFATAADYADRGADGRRDHQPGYRRDLIRTVTRRALRIAVVITAAIIALRGRPTRVQVYDC